MGWRRRKGIAAVALALVSVACSNTHEAPDGTTAAPSASSGAEAAPSAVASVATDLVPPGPLADTVAAIAAGPTPGWSDLHRSLEGLAPDARAEAAIALLRHASPAVRLAAATCIVRDMPEHVDALAPLLADRSEPPDDWSERPPRSVGEAVVLWVATSHDPHAQAFLLDVARGRSDVALPAFQHLPKDVQDAERPEIVGRWLRESSVDDLDAARALALFGSAPRPDQCDAVARWLGSSVESTRSRAAQELAYCIDPASVAALRTAFADVQPFVAMAAKGSAILNPGPAEERHRILEAADRDLRRHLVTAAQLAFQNPPTSVAALRTLDTILDVAPPPVRDGSLCLWKALSMTAESKEATAKMRQLLEHAPPTCQEETRRGALEYLDKVQDRASLPAFRHALESSDDLEVVIGIEGVIRFEDTSSIPALQRLATRPVNGHVGAARDVPGTADIALRHFEGR